MVVSKSNQDLDVVTEKRSKKSAKSSTPKANSRENNAVENINDSDLIDEPVLSTKLGNQGISLVCSQGLLNDALTFVKSSVPSKPLHPVLANTLITADAEEQQITLTVSDMALTISATIEAQVETSGEITLPVEVMVGVVSKCPTGNITLTSSNQVIPGVAPKAKSKTKGNSESYIAQETVIHHLALLEDEQGGMAEIRGIDAEEFPSITAVKSKPISLPAKVIKTGLKGALFATSTDDTKKILTGMQWTLNHTQDTLSCTGTDGHQVALISLSTGGIGRKRRKPDNLAQNQETTRCVIPAKALKELTRNLDKVEPDELLLFAYDTKAMRVLFELTDESIHKQIICQCLEDGYPDCQLLVDRYTYPKHVTVEKSALLVKLDRLSVLADKKENGIKLFFDSSTQEISLSIERDYGKGQQVVSADIPSEVDQMEITFNIHYLLNALKALSSSAVCITMDKPYTPTSLRPAGDMEIAEINMEATYFILPLYDREKAEQAMKAETAELKP